MQLNEKEEPLKVLIADDSNSDRLLLKAIVQKQGHEVVLAEDGAKAVDAFIKECPDLVLLDCLMPVMDGFDAARKIKAHSGEDFVPIIFLTSLTDAESLATGLEAGGDDFLSKPYNHVVLKAKIKAFSRMRTMHRTMQQQRDQIVVHNEHLIQEQEVAKRVYDKVAHQGCLNVSNIKYTLSPLAVFNGDVILAAVRPSGNISVLLGDFTGHGLAAAIGAMPLAQTFYSMNAKGFGMKDLLREMNSKLKDILPVSVFCCASMIDMDLREKTVEVWNGGLPDNFFYHAKTGKVQPLAPKHLPLGVQSPKNFNTDTEIFEMHDGDRIFMWSDGILEASNQDGEMFGDERLMSVFENNQDVETLFDDLNQRVLSFIGDSERDDDLSIIEISMVDKEEFDTHNVVETHNAYQGPMDWSFSYDARPDTLRHFSPLPVVLSILMDVPGLRPHGGDIYTVLTELFNNALDHGVLGLDSAQKATPDGFAQYYKDKTDRLNALEAGFVRFELDYNGDEKGGFLTIRVKDSGGGFDYKSMMHADHKLEGYCGRGLPLLNSLCETVTYHGLGNDAEVLFQWKNPGMIN